MSYNNRRPDETPPTLPYAYVHGGDCYSPIYEDETPNHTPRPQSYYPNPRHRPSPFYQHSILKAGRMGTLPPTLSTNQQRPPSPSRSSPPSSLTPTSSNEVDTMLTSPTFTSRDRDPKTSSTESINNSSTTPPPPSGSKTFLEMIQEKVDGYEKTIRALTSQLEDSQVELENQKNTFSTELEDSKRVHAGLKDDLLTQLKGVEDKLRVEKDKVKTLEENGTAEAGKLKAALVTLERLRTEKKRLVEEKQSEVVLSEEMNIRLQEMAKEKAEFTHRALQAEGNVNKMNGLIEDSKARESQLNVRIVHLDAELKRLRTKMEEEARKDKSVLKHLQQVSRLTKEKESLEAEVVSLVARVGEAKEREDRSWKELGAVNKAKSELEKKVGIERNRADEALNEMRELKAKTTNDLQEKDDQISKMALVRDGLVIEHKAAIERLEEKHEADKCQVERGLTSQRDEMTRKYEAEKKKVIAEHEAEKARLVYELEDVKGSLATAQLDLKNSQSSEKKSHNCIRELEERIKALENNLSEAEQRSRVLESQIAKEKSLFEREKVWMGENTQLRNQIRLLESKRDEDTCVPHSPHHLHLEDDSTLPIPSQKDAGSIPSSPLSSIPPSPAVFPSPATASLEENPNSILDPSSSTDDQGGKFTLIAKAKLESMQDELRAAKLEVEKLMKEKEDARRHHSSAVSATASSDTPKSSTRVANPFGEYNFVSDMWSKEVREEPDWVKRHELQLRELLAVRAAKKDRALINLLKRGMGEKEDDGSSDQDKIRRPPQKKRIFL